MNNLRREGENKKAIETKAAATGAKFAVMVGLFKLCRFICYSVLFFKIAMQKFALNLTYASEKFIIRYKLLLNRK